MTEATRDVCSTFPGTMAGRGSGKGRVQLATVRGEHQVQRGQLQHALHPGHGQAAEPDLRRLTGHTGAMEVARSTRCQSEVTTPDTHTQLFLNI